MAASGGIRQVVVVGANIAGASAVEALRRAGYDGRLVLIGAEAELPYERPPLSKEYLLGERAEDQLFLRPAAFYDEMNVELRLGTRAEALDTTAREVVLADGARVGFDRLLIATGSHVRHLLLPGGDLSGVHYLRTLADGRALAAEMRCRRRGFWARCRDWRRLHRRRGRLGLPLARIGCHLDRVVAAAALAGARQRGWRDLRRDPPQAWCRLTPG